MTGFAVDLCHPLPLLAVLVLAINDHWLKGAGLLPGALTGKLSDFAGLFFFPMLLVALAHGAAALVRLGAPARARCRRIAVVVAPAATAAVFAAVKTWPAFNERFCALAGPMAVDPTDLVALPMCFLAWCWMKRGERRLRCT